MENGTPNPTIDPLTARRKPSELQVHPAAALFPSLSEAELQDLADDIAENGQRTPITVWRDQILDGRMRLAACTRLGRVPVIEERNFPDEESAVRFVVSMNLKRRHLSESQRAMVAAELSDLRLGAGATGKFAGMSQAEAATHLNVSERSVRDARKVLKKGSPALIKAVTADEVAVSSGAVLTRLSTRGQDAVVAKGRAETRRVVKKIKSRRKRKLTLRHQPDVEQAANRQPAEPEQDFDQPDAPGSITNAQDVLEPVLEAGILDDRVTAAHDALGELKPELMTLQRRICAGEPVDQTLAKAFARRLCGLGALGRNISDRLGKDGQHR